MVEAPTAEVFEHAVGIVVEPGITLAPFTGDFVHVVVDAFVAVAENRSVGVSAETRANAGTSFHLPLGMLQVFPPRGLLRRRQRGDAFTSQRLRGRVCPDDGGGQGHRSKYDSQKEWSFEFHASDASARRLHRHAAIANCQTNPHQSLAGGLFDEA